jgi:hypothetical protein
MAKNHKWEERVKGPEGQADAPERGLSGIGRKAHGMGTPETERNIANKISRGGFTAAIFVECLSAIGCTALRLEDA